MACLLLTAMIWGFSFVSQVAGMDSTSPMFFNATRFTLGAVSLLPVLLMLRRRRTAEGNAGAASHAAAALSAKRTVLVSALCGLVLFSASTLQQYGILYGRSAGRAGFITALYIVMVPLLAWVFLRRRVTLFTGMAVVLAVIGFYLLCMTDSGGALTLGDAMVFLCAILFAVHILVIDTLASGIDPVLLSFGQFVTTALLSWMGSLLEGSVNWTGAADAWLPILYSGIGSVGIAYTLQVVGQQWVPPTRASLIMSLESFFSAVGGALLLGEVMTARGYWGCILIFAGTMLAQLPPRLPRWMSGKAL
ncbi:EamA family transporter [Bifidobacterium sp. SMB2]|uniref:EamA family transporter n=1 Tax=Bifidobacterium saimiriisciurei TaxID=2661627 RepID=A0ABX0CF34_9BIFI|nr:MULTISPECIES: DMT family transporter [Bifidobacterium]NEG95811.1 EamA family transporter [Bifidobacterium sp. SMB2]NEH11238.1 EamA family transporter [Bifidobacterium saimiriisciurei]